MENPFYTMTILESTKAAIKLGFFYVVDLMIISGPMWILFEINTRRPLPQVHFITLMILWFLFGVFLCVKNKSNAHVRNYVVIIKLIRMDRNTYAFDPCRGGTVHGN